MNPEVIIIGAGAAGLAAALELSNHKIPCLILEARQRIGGRIFTITDTPASSPSGLGIELGAESIHGYPEHTLHLLETLGLEAYEIPDDHLAVKKGRGKDIPHFWEEMAPALNARPLKGKADRSFADYLNQSKLPRAKKKQVGNFVQGFHAADLHEMSQKALSVESLAAEEMDGDRALRLLGGYGGFVEALFQKISKNYCQLFLDHPVQNISWKQGSVEVDAGKKLGKYTSPKILITVPPGPLKNLRFSPELKQKEFALDHLQTGAVIKVVVRLKKRFWESLLGRTVTFIHSEQNYFPVWWTARPMLSPVLTGWTGGPPATELSKLSSTQLHSQVRQSLAYLFNQPEAEIRKWIESIHFHNWQTDPYSQGGYSYIKVGGITAPEQLARPVEGTLFFAGEATESAGLGGTVESALRSGFRAAREIAG